MGGVATFSPNGDGAGDTARFAFHMSEPGLVFGTVRDANGDKTTTFSGQAATTSGTVSWDGRRADGSYVPDGVYSVALSPRDVAGNVGSSVGTSVAVYTALSRVKAASYAFWPNDRDGYASRMWLAFELDTAARVTWTLSDPAGATVMTFLDDVESPAGRYAIPWDGRLPGGRFAPAGIYTSRVVVTDGTLRGVGGGALPCQRLPPVALDVEPVARRRRDGDHRGHGADEGEPVDHRQPARRRLVHGADREDQHVRVPRDVPALPGRLGRHAHAHGEGLRRPRWVQLVAVRLPAPLRSDPDGRPATGIAAAHRTAPDRPVPPLRGTIGSMVRPGVPA